ncbi:PLD nuclease N-terminal domain-containing protein [Georgenia sp. Z1491]|uniref:PLD nuclease N-terminal domain-containing protein n=1 Tax=Georgenia sp. Z1491 TaxID=3416707 RepID=UPI003CF3EEDE
MQRAIPIVIAVGVIVFALIDCARSDDERMPARIPKGVWIVLILLLPVIGAVAWLVLSRTLARATGGPDRTGGTGSFGAGPTRQPRRPVAPDDDPEFLARLEADRRRAERERRQRARDAERENPRATAAEPTTAADAPDDGDPGTDRRSDADGPGDDDGDPGPAGGLAVDPRESPGSPA